MYNKTKGLLAKLSRPFLFYYLYATAYSSISVISTLDVARVAGFA